MASPKRRRHSEADQDDESKAEAPPVSSPITLEEQAAVFNAMFENSPDSVAFCDSSLRLRSVTPSFAREAGVPVEQLVGRRGEEVVPGWAEQVEHVYWEVRRTGKPFKTEAFPFVYKNHPERGITYWDFSVSPVYSERNVFLGYLVWVHDATERKRAEEESSRLAAIADSSGDAIIGLTLTGVIETWNPGAERLYGYASDEIEGKSIAALFPADRLGELDEILTRIRRGDRVEYEETLRRRKHGEQIAVSTHISPILARTGEVVGVSWLARDITQDKRLEDELRRREQWLRGIYEESPIGIELYGPDGRLIDANKACLEIFGVSQPGEIRGLDLLADPNVTDEIKSQLREGLTVRYEAAFDFEKVKNLKLYNTESSGVKYLDVLITPLDMKEGMPFGGYLVQIQDVTERSSAEAALRKARDEMELRVRERTAELVQVNQRLLQSNLDTMENAAEAGRRASQMDTIIESIADGVFLCDKNGRVTEVNEAGLRLIGLQKKEEALLPLVDYLNMLDLRQGDGRLVAVEDQAIYRALHGETVKGDEEIARNLQTKQNLYLLVSAAPVRGGAGDIVGAVAVMSDITNIRELDKLKDQFISVTAHELKTPVAIMKGYAQAFLRTAQDLSGPHRRMLQAIDRGADRISRIVQDLLDISRIHFGQLELTEGRFDLAELVEDVANRMDLTTTKNRIRVTTSAPLAIQGDRDRLELVLFNLIDNAVRYSPHGGDIEVSMVVGDKEAVVSVTDRGVGIPQEKQHHIFERFYRAHTGTPYDYGGMGVGLYISKEIILRHGGRIWFESEEVIGSTFHFSLPLSRAYIYPPPAP